MQKEMNEKELLKYWQDKLCLSDWRIKLAANCRPDEMMMDDVAGCTDWTESNKIARIEILSPKYYGERIVPFNFEKTLIHELLHLKFSFWCQGRTDIGDRLMHQMIDDLARAFAEVKDS